MALGPGLAGWTGTRR